MRSTKFKFNKNQRDLKIQFFSEHLQISLKKNCQKERFELLKFMLHFSGPQNGKIVFDFLKNPRIHYTPGVGLANL